MKCATCPLLNRPENCKGELQARLCQVAKERCEYAKLFYEQATGEAYPVECEQKAKTDSPPAVSHSVKGPIQAPKVARKPCNCGNPELIRKALRK